MTEPLAVHVVAERSPPPTLARAARLAAWLGLVGFGGGYAVLAQIQGVIVRRWAWLTEDEFAEAVSISQSLPGASGANFFTQLGMRFGGIGGALLTTSLFLLPSTVVMVLFGAFYDRLRDADRVEAVFAGMNPAVVGIVATVAWTLVKRARKPWQIGLAVLAALAVEAGLAVSEVVLITIGLSLSRYAWKRVAERASKPPMLSIAPWLVLTLQLAFVFVRIGAVTFGGGMAMIPMLDHQLVGSLHWLSEREFADAVTLGQITPGPVAITATFVGYRIDGLTGALLATVATFAPAFIATVLVTRSVQAFRNSPIMTSLFDTLAPVIAGVVAAAAISLGRTSLHDWVDGGVAVGSVAAAVLLEAPTLLILAVAALVRALPLFL